MGPNRTVTVPWIAYISCDQNETNASNEWGASSPLVLSLAVQCKGREA